MKLLLCLMIVSCAAMGMDSAEEPIFGYHFHTYYFQMNKNQMAGAIALRTKIENEIENGTLTDCSLNRLNVAPRGPHPIGSWETCCNISSVANAVSFFMKNRGEFNVMLHPLTTSEVEDHINRSFWLGQRMSLDINQLRPHLHEIPVCPQYFD